MDTEVGLRESLITEVCLVMSLWIVSGPLICRLLSGPGYGQGHGLISHTDLESQLRPCQLWDPGNSASLGWEALILYYFKEHQIVGVLSP